MERFGRQVRTGRDPFLTFPLFEQCTRREALEESGLEVGRLELRGFLTFPLFDGSDDWYVFVFTSSDFKGEVTSSGEGELAWVANDKLLELNLHEGDRVFLPWLQEGEARGRGLFSGRFLYEGGVFRGYEVVWYGGRWLLER